MPVRDPSNLDLRPLGALALRWAAVRCLDVRCNRAQTEQSISVHARSLENNTLDEQVPAHHLVRAHGPSRHLTNLQRVGGERTLGDDVRSGEVRATRRTREGLAGRGVHRREVHRECSLQRLLLTDREGEVVVPDGGEDFVRSAKGSKGR